MTVLLRDEQSAWCVIERRIESRDRRHIGTVDSMGAIDPIRPKFPRLGAMRSPQVAPREFCYVNFNQKIESIFACRRLVQPLCNQAY